MDRNAKGYMRVQQLKNTCISGLRPHFSEGDEGAAGGGEPHTHLDQHRLPQVLRRRPPTTAAAATLQRIRGLISPNLQT